jgi:hypothetical protein
MSPYEGGKSGCPPRGGGSGRDESRPYRDGQHATRIGVSIKFNSQRDVKRETIDETSSETR